MDQAEPALAGRDVDRAPRRRRRWWLISLGGAATGIWSFILPQEHSATQRHVESAPAASVTPSPLHEAPARLPRRQTLRSAHADPFAARSWAPPAPLPVQVAPAAPPPPGAPPNPYRFAGTARYGGSLMAVLAIGDRVQPVTPGEVLEGGYKVMSISRDAVTLLYTPLGVEQQIAFAAEAPPPASPQSAAVAAPQPAAPGESPFPRGSPLAVR